MRMSRRSASVARQPHLRVRELQRRLPGPVHVALAGHRLDVAVPLEVERLAAKTHRSADLVLCDLISRELVDDRDLTIAVTRVLLRVQLICRRRALAEPVVAHELLEHACSRAVRATVHRLDECEERDAL